jgi:hypothetical protein
MKVQLPLSSSGFAAPPLQSPRLVRCSAPATLAGLPPRALARRLACGLLLTCFTLLRPAAEGAAGTVIAWGDNSQGQTNVPAGLTNVIAIAAGDAFSLALREDGTVAAWGHNGHGILNLPLGLNNVVAISAGANHALALRIDGTVVGWGAVTPPALTDVVAISAGGGHGLALRGNGTVVGWGYNAEGQASPPTTLSNVVAISTRWNHCLALKNDGTVAGWGLNNFGQINIPGGLSGAISIAVGGENYSLALKSDGTVEGWGRSTPPALNNTVAIAAGWSHSLGLRTDGTVIAWGSQSTVPLSVTNITAIAAGWNHNLAIQAPFSPSITSEPLSQSVEAGFAVMFQVSANGESPLLYQWRKEGIAIPDATNATLELTGVTKNDAGRYDVVVSNPFGTATSTGAFLQVLPFGAPSIRMNEQIVAGAFSVPEPQTITVSLTGGFTNGFIFYTLDGTEPNLGSPFYTGPFTLSNNAVVVAMSLSEDLAQTAVSPPVKALIVPTYGLVTSADGNGTVTVSPVLAAYPSNSVVTLRALPGPHIAFSHWTGDLTGGANPASLTMNGPRSVQAVFVAGEYPLTLSATMGGVARANGQSIGPETWFPVGSVVALAAVPDAGWGFLRWQAR